MAKDNQNAMVFFYDWLDLFEDMTDAEIGQVVMAAVRYSMSKEDTRLNDRCLRTAFASIKNSIDLQEHNGEHRSRKAQGAAQVRWSKENAIASDENAIACNENATACNTNATASEENAIASDADANDATRQDNTIQDNTIHNNTRQDNTRHNKTKQVVDLHTAFGMVEERHYPPDLDDAVRGWLTYKQQRKEGYVEEGLKSLLTRITDSAKKCGSEAVAEVIGESMGNGYKGIVWDRLQDQKPPGAWNNNQNKSVAEQVSQFYIIGGERDPWRESQNSSS